MKERFELDVAEPEEPGLLMTSMIDVIFILLAFFVCVSEVKKGKLTVDVPEVAAVEESAEPGPVEPVVVEVTRGDEVYVGGERATDGEHLERLLRQLATTRGVAPGRIPLHLSGDQRASNGAMMRVMGRASKVGFQKIEFAVEAGGR
ncbi:MAG: ExbD/TolR family protein [Planctomycetota bacterium]